LIIIPSLSPWFVGVYECMVKIMEKFLKPLSGRKLLFYEELRTIFIEVKLLQFCYNLNTYYNFEIV